MDPRKESGQSQSPGDQGLADDEGGDDCLPSTQYQRRLEVQTELRSWSDLTRAQRETTLKKVIAGSDDLSIEALVTISREAWLNEDRPALNLAFEALAKRTTPLLMSRAWGLGIEEKKDQVQEILLEVFKAITGDKFEYLEVSFAGFARRKAIDLFRRRSATIEGVSERIEPTEDGDPVEDLTYAGELDCETQVGLEEMVNLLSKRDREIYIQYHYLELTQEEIAAQHDVTVKTVYNRLVAAQSIFASVRRDT